MMNQGMPPRSPLTSVILFLAIVGLVTVFALGTYVGYLISLVVVPI